MYGKVGLENVIKFLGHVLLLRHYLIHLHPNSELGSVLLSLTPDHPATISKLKVQSRYLERGIIKMSAEILSQHGDCAIRARVENLCPASSILLLERVIKRAHRTVLLKDCARSL